MTGFGRSEKEREGHKICVEVKSVNHRFLDMGIRVPRFMMSMEDDVRALLKKRLVRGRLDVFVNYTPTREEEKTVHVNMGLARAYLTAGRTLSSQTGIENDLTLSSVLRLPDVVIFEDPQREGNEIKELLMEALDEAVDALTAARNAEGIRISEDIFARISLLESIVDQIAEREPLVAEEHREKLRTRIAQFLSETELDETRFNAEIVFFAERCSITEELVRLKSHLKQCAESLASNQASGRNMDFIVQELNREFNTIGSKSSDLTITKLVLAGKSEVEKIREQIQNIE